MTELESKVSVTILETLAEHENLCYIGGVHDVLNKIYGDSHDAKRAKMYAFDKLENEYGLVSFIGEKRNQIRLTDNGELANKIGFDKYIKKMHKNERLDIKLKRLDLAGKWIDLLDKSKTLIIIMLTLMAALIVLALWSVSLLSEKVGWMPVFVIGFAIGAAIVWLLMRRSK